MGKIGRVSLALLMLFIGVTKGQRRTAEPVPRFCGGHPADLIFVMDSSGSIGHNEFVRQKEFVSGMVDLFDINSGKIRVGVVTYSNWAFLEFNLNTYTKKSDIRSAVNKVTHFRGDTNTGSTIAFMREVMFSPYNGARENVPRIAIVLTDGRSNDPLYTMRESEKARADGITMFAIGVGDDVSRYELSSIGSDPDESYVFKVGDYDALQRIKEELAIRACEVLPPFQSPTPSTSTTEETTTTTTTTTTTAIPTTTVPIEEACKGIDYADIVFATAAASSATNSDKTLDFIRNVVEGFDMSNGRLRVGMVPSNCDSLSSLQDIHIKGDGNIKEKDIMNKIDMIINNTQPYYTSNIINFMRKVSFSKDNGARRESKRIGVLIVDDGDILSKAQREALKAKTLGGIELYVIAVGTDFNKTRLGKIASRRSNDHVFYVNSYDDLPNILQDVQNRICPPSGSSTSL